MNENMDKVQANRSQLEEELRESAEKRESIVQWESQISDIVQS